jgi:NADH:ubiquinone reductase (H+-translocating)
MSSHRPRVAIVGAGFGGLYAAKALAGKPVDVLLIDRYNYHLFQPLLYQVATAGLEPDEIAYPVRRTLHRLPNVNFRLAEVRGIDLDGRLLDTDTGAIGYDYLILTTGSENNFFGNDRLAERAHGLKNLQQAVALRNHLLTCFERAAPLPSSPERQALLTFVIGGGGPTGVEFAGALSELATLVTEHDFKGTLQRSEIKLLLVEGGPDLLGTFHPSLRRAALRELRHKGVHVKVDARIQDYDGEMVSLADGSRIAARTLMWAAGVQGSTAAKLTGLPLARGARLAVGPSLQLANRPEVFIVGDLAYLEDRGEPLPQLAPVAIQQGELAAENVVRHLHGVPLLPFHYRDKGTLATIGRNAAVAQFGPLRLRGFVAWFMWLAVHIALLIGFRNRVVVLLDWAWNYFSYERALRLITQR